MTSEQLAEYSKIAQEITERLNIRYTCELTVYTVSLVFIGLGWELDNSIFFLLTFVIIIPINLSSASNLNMIVVLGEYLRAFYEGPDSPFRWESEYAKLIENEKTRKLMRGFIYKTGHYGSSIMAIVAVLCIIIRFYTNDSNNAAAVWFIPLGLVGVMLTIMSNFYIVHSDDRREKYRDFFNDNNRTYHVHSSDISDI